MSDEALNQINTKLSAILALMANHMNPAQDENPRSPEEILTACGMKSHEVGAILGKNGAAVRKAVQRAKNKIKAK